MKFADGSLKEALEGPMELPNFKLRERLYVKRSGRNYRSVVRMWQSFRDLEELLNQARQEPMFFGYEFPTKIWETVLLKYEKLIRSITDFYSVALSIKHIREDRNQRLLERLHVEGWEDVGECFRDTFKTMADSLTKNKPIDPPRSEKLRRVFGGVQSQVFKANLQNLSPDELFLMGSVTWSLNMIIHAADEVERAVNALFVDRVVNSPPGYFIPRCW